MKLLFDQNISFRIIQKLQSDFPNSSQVRELNLEDTSDIDIWSYAKENGFTIVTFDTDFADIANIKGCPPKIIWLRTGNLTTSNIVKILRKHQIVLREFIQGADYKDIACLEIQ